jgi:SAM-dependent methyltransferase
LRVSGSSYGIGLGNDWSDEERRLAGAEELFDPGTFRHLDTIGIAAGMRCLELGGGGGSVARFMAERVGLAGWVLVTDIDAGKLVGCDRPNIEVRVHDICTDPVDHSAFDIIHARLLLEHLPPRLALLDKLIAALRPGGWLLVEDLDVSGWLYLPGERLLCEPKQLHAPYRATIVGSALIGATSGWDAEFGRELPLHLANAGLDRVDGEVRSPLIVGGSSRAAFVSLSLRQLGPVLVDSGSISQRELDYVTAAFESPGAMMAPLTMVSAWGRRPS